MREIKFRAWEISLEEMIPVDRIDFKNRIINTGGPWRFFKEIELMQYTGLKDKNGVEIYEGDVLSMNLKDFAETEGPHKFIVDDFAYDLAYLSQINQFIEENDSEDLEDFIEVIGNIYENPELLEESK